jgi:hypothetical protein
MSRAGNVEPKTHHLWQFGLAYRVLHRSSDGNKSHRLVPTQPKETCETMGQVPQCTGRLCLRNKSIFQITTRVCLSSISICNLLIDKFLPIQTSVYFSFKHILVSLTSFILMLLLAVKIKWTVIDSTGTWRLTVSVIRRDFLSPLILQGNKPLTCRRLE